MKIVFMGTPKFAVPILKSLALSRHELVAVIAQPDKAQGRKHLICETPVHALCKEMNLPYMAPTKLKDGAVAEHIKKLGAEIIVTAAYGRILPLEILQAPSKAAINIHASLLPKYRGSSPIQEALINQDEYTGISIIRMVEEMDAGNILKTVKYKIEEEDTTEILMEKLSNIAVTALLPLLDDIESGLIQEVVQTNEGLSFAPMIEKSRGAIKWEDNTSKSLYAMYRALHPWPGIYCNFNNKTVKLKKITQVKDFEALNKYENYLLNLQKSGLNKPKAGYILPLYKHRLLVKTCDSIIEILSLQVENQKEVSATQCAHNFINKYFEDAIIV